MLGRQPLPMTTHEMALRSVIAVDCCVYLQNYAISQGNGASYNMAATAQVWLTVSHLDQSEVEY